MFAKAFYALAWFSIIAGTILILLVTYWLNWPYKPLIIKSPITIITKDVKAGEMVSYFIDYCKTMPIPSTLTKEYIDGIVFASPPIIVNNPVGCRVMQGMTLVPNLPSGEYQIRFTYVYKVNPIREISVVAQSDTLMIVEEK